MEPRLSIITINYNNAKGLSKTVESVFSQTFQPIEYIIIDGGSTDGSIDIIKKFEDKISYWVSEKDNGIYNAQNKGIIKASGEYLLFLNSGDYLCNDETLSKAFAYEPIEDIIYGKLYIDYGRPQFTLADYPTNLTFSYFFNNGYLPHPSSFIKRRLFLQAGLYNESFKIVSDWEFWLKAIFLNQASYKRIPLPISVYNYEGVSSKNENEGLKNFEKEEVYKKYFLGIIGDYKELNALKEKIEKSRLLKVLKRLKLVNLN